MRRGRAWSLVETAAVRPAGGEQERQQERPPQRDGHHGAERAGEEPEDQLQGSSKGVGVPRGAAGGGVKWWVVVCGVA